MRLDLAFVFLFASSMGNIVENLLIASSVSLDASGGFQFDGIYSEGLYSSSWFIPFFVSHCFSLIVRFSLSSVRSMLGFG